MKTKTLNAILRDLREDHDIKQETIAKYLGISQQTYSNYENDRREIPIEAVKKLAAYYKVSTDYLLRSDTSYMGSLDLNASYVDDLTIHDIIYDINTLNEANRKNLVKYIRFLHQDIDNK
ncbi:MAG: helix-turn-helix transcriptional regulator [Lachnospiraceae bacterium]|nr:helix-turn-helix transcriptional regulator [Lachnospiraceae bacterium]